MPDLYSLFPLPFSMAAQSGIPERSANEVRADRAMDAVAAHSKFSADHYELPSEQFTDLLVNLVHLSHRLGLDMDTSARHAMIMARDEITEADPACARTGKGRVEP